MLDREGRRNNPDRELEFVEGRRQPEYRRSFDTKLVLTAADVLDERVPSDHNAGPPVSLQPAQRPPPGLESSVIGLAPVVLNIWFKPELKP